jgi:hypothetical protein
MDCAAIAQTEALVEARWESTLESRLPALGHRNWIAIVDSAYPAQASPGIETVVTGDEQLDVVKIVLDRLAAAPHVRPVIHLDAELAHIDVADAPGIDQYRADLAQLLPKEGVRREPHAAIIKKLDAAGQKFRVLVLKTTLTLPYTSVFIELDCGYWSSDAEQRLRAKLQAERQ